MPCDLHADPFERAEDESIRYNQWWAERLLAIAPASAFVADWLQSFKEFRPR